QDLDRHRIPGLDHAADIDLAHAAHADRAIDLVDAVEARAGGQAGATDACLHVGRAHSARSPPAAAVPAPRRGALPGREWAVATVTLSRAPRSSVSAIKASHACCERLALTQRRISSSCTCLVSPSLQTTNESPARSGPLVISSSGRS